MQVILLAGGKGTRLYPYTVALPKPLVPVGDRPIIEIVLSQLKQCGATDVIISTGHLSHLIRAYVGDGSRMGVPVRYVEEKQPMGTAGSLSLVGDLQEHFLVVNGDVLTGLDFGAFFRRHTSRGAAASIGLCRREAAIDFGVVDLDGAGRLLEYREKPRLPYFVSMGINAFHRRSLAHLKPNEALGMPDFFLRLKAAGELVCGDVCDVDWLDIGRPEDYELANKQAAGGSTAPPCP